MRRINLFCGLFNRLYMGGNLQPCESKWSMICFPWATIVIYLSLFGIWKVQFKTMYIALKLANSFWIRISILGKRWMYIHMLCYWCFTCALEFYFSYQIRVHRQRKFQMQSIQLVNKHCQEFNQTNCIEFQGTQRWT